MEKNFDKIVISNLEVFAKHGVNKEEKILGQKFMVSLELFLDTALAGRSDDLTATINYAKVCHYVERYMKSKSYNLIEAAAEYLARDLLLKYGPLLQEVTVTVSKPWAPIGMSFENVSVSIHRGWHKVMLSIGSNMGDREKYIRDAIKTIGKHKLCKSVKCSKIIETEPYGGVEQDKFLNCALEVRTLLDPVELLALCNSIEDDAKRERKVHWGPRTLDVDILFYDSEVIAISSPDLTIPHKDLHNRLFVLEPLSEIAPGLVHPLYNQTIRSMYENLKK